MTAERGAGVDAGVGDLVGPGEVAVQKLRGGARRDRPGVKPPEEDFKLAAMRWPERVLVFDDGTQAISENFEHSVALRD